MCSGCIPAHLMASFLNGTHLASVEVQLHCWHGCCQVVHKLTTKPVALAFPRPSGAVMFTTPCPQPDTLMCQSLLNQLVQQSFMSIKQKRQTVICAGFEIYLGMKGERLP